MELDEVPSYKLKDQWVRKPSGRDRRKKKKAGGGWFSRFAGGGPSAAASGTEAASSASESVQAIERLLGLGTKYGGGAAAFAWKSALAIPALSIAVGAGAYGLGRVFAPPKPSAAASGDARTALFEKLGPYKGKLSKLPTTTQAIDSLGLGSHSPAPVASSEAAAPNPPRAKVLPQSPAAAASARAGRGSSSGGVAAGAVIPHVGQFPGGRSAVSNTDARALSPQGRPAAVSPKDQHTHALAALFGGASPSMEKSGAVGGAIQGEALGQLGGANRFSNAGLQAGVQEGAAGNAGMAFDHGAALPTTVGGGVALTGAGDGSSNPGAQPAASNSWGSAGSAPGSPMGGGGGARSLPTAGSPAGATDNGTQTMIDIATGLLLGAMVLLLVARFAKGPWAIGLKIAAAVAAAAAAAIGGALMSSGHFWTGLMFLVPGGIMAAMAAMSAWGAMTAGEGAASGLQAQISSMYTTTSSAGSTTTLSSTASSITTTLGGGYTSTYSGAMCTSLTSPGG